jgi:hypothetical protein
VNYSIHTLGKHFQSLVVSKVCIYADLVLVLVLLLKGDVERKVKDDIKYSQLLCSMVYVLGAPIFFSTINGYIFTSLLNRVESSRVKRYQERGAIEEFPHTLS